MMKQLVSLILLEYKKIFKKKWLIATLIFIFAIANLSVYGTLMGHTYRNGQRHSTKLQEMKLDQQYSFDLAGRKLDTPLFKETVEAYRTLEKDTGYMAEPNYQLYARPYSSIRGFMQRTYQAVYGRFGVKELKNLDIETLDRFYSDRQYAMRSRVNSLKASQDFNSRLLTLNNQVKTPFIYDDTGGYYRFIVLLISTGMLISIALAMTLAPLFAEEYTLGTDSFILSSKNGKSKHITAKIITAFSFTLIYTLMILVSTYVMSMITFGSNGGDAPIQLLYPLLPYPLTVLQTTLLFSFCALCSCLLITALTLFFSTLVKTPFKTIIIMFIIIFLPMFITVSDRNTLSQNLLALLPLNMMIPVNLTRLATYKIFNLTFLPLEFIPLFTLGSTALLILLTKILAKKHEVYS